MSPQITPNPLIPLSSRFTPEQMADPDSIYRQYHAITTYSAYGLLFRDGEIPLEEIQILNPEPNDGLITLYFGEEKEVYLGTLDARNRLLEILHGVYSDPNRDPARIKWDLPIPEFPTSICSTVKVLGGTKEEKFICPADPIPKPSPSAYPKKSFLPTPVYGALGWASLEAAGWLAKRTSLTLAGLKSAKGNMLTKEAWKDPGAKGVGAMALYAGMELGKEYLGDWLGLDEKIHYQERYSLGALAGYGAYRGASALWGKIFPKNKIQTVRFGSLALGANVLNLLARDLFFSDVPEGISSKIRDVSWFALALWGTRALPEGVATTATGAFSTPLKWLGRAAAGGFFADTLYLGFRWFTEGPSLNTYNHLTEEIAWHYQRQDQGMVTGFLSRVGEVFAPALTRKLFLEDRFVSRARWELQQEARPREYYIRQDLSKYLLGATDALRLQPDFYQKVDLEWLTRPSALQNIRTSSGKELPVTSVYEQLSDPKIGEKVISMTPQDGVAYIRRQFRGYELTKAETEQIFLEIKRFFIRKNISELYRISTPQATPILEFFTEEGRLKAGKEDALVAHLLSYLELETVEDLLLLRKALLLKDLSNQDLSEEQYLQRFRLAQEIGLLDERGQILNSKVMLYLDGIPQLLGGD